MPIDIDVDVLKKYVYEMNFSGVKVKALKVEGYYHVAYPHLKSLTTDLVFGPTSGVNNGTIMYCVAKSTAVITVDGIDLTYSALGSCGSNETRVPAQYMGSIAETRAMKRVLHRALDLARFNISNLDEMDDDDSGDSTPTKPPGTLNDLSVPAAVASGEAAGMPRKSKLPSSEGASDW